MFENIPLIKINLEFLQKLNKKAPESKACINCKSNCLIIFEIKICRNSEVNFNNTI